MYKRQVSEGFEKLNFHVAFIQEGRYPKNRVMSFGNTLMCIASQKDAGRMDAKFGYRCLNPSLVSTIGKNH